MTKWFGKLQINTLFKVYMSRVLKEITIIAGQYKNKDGQQKNRYQRIGSIIETKNGDMLKLDQMPLIDGGWNGWAYINEPRQQDDAPQQRRQTNDDDIPF
jgi:hypothetical protein